MKIHVYSRPEGWRAVKKDMFKTALYHSKKSVKSIAISGKL